MSELADAPADGAVHLRIAGGIAAVTFDRPQARNAMTWAMYQALGGICERVAADPAVRVLTLRGAGGQAFVAGTDIAQFAAFADGEDGIAYERGIDAGIALLEGLPMPTVALVDGWAVGGGLALATACDFRIASAGARFGVPIARTLGNCLSIANLARLRAAFGPQPVRRMLLLAETLTAAEALACGFLETVCDGPDALGAAGEQLCHRLAALAPVTQAVSKEGLRRLALHALPEADDLVRRAYGSADFHEGVAAFTARRQPSWQGR